MSFSNVFARCVGFIMAKMVLRDLMDPMIFAKFKAFLSKVIPLNPCVALQWNHLLLAEVPYPFCFFVFFFLSRSLHFGAFRETTLPACVSF